MKHLTTADRLYLGTAIIFVILQATDAFMTMWALNHGYYESNPLMRSLVESTGTWILPLVKIPPSIMGALLVFWLLKKYRRIQPVGILFIASATGLYVYIFIHNIGQLGG
jgi:uncharacterized membrane protein